MVESDHRVDAMLQAARQYAPVVLELGGRELSLFGFYASPLDRESVGIEPQLGEENYIFGIAMVVVTGVTGGLPAGRA
jgi:hypothetical protein